MSKSTQTQQSAFFNLHTTGIGYLSNIREVQPKKGNAFLSCNISALTGDVSEPEYRFFNVNVAGEQNEKLIRRCQQAVNAKKKVLISFTLGDLWTDHFVYDKDTQYHKKGDIGVTLKARLINIKSITIDGEKVYTASSPSKEQATVEAAPSEESIPNTSSPQQDSPAVNEETYPEDSF